MNAKDIKVCGVTADSEPAGGGSTHGIRHAEAEVGHLEVGNCGGSTNGISYTEAQEERMKLKIKKVAELNWKLFEAYREAGFTADDAVCLVARHGIKVSEYKL